MSFGRKYALIFLVLGVVLCGGNLLMISSAGRFFPKLLIAGFSLITLSIGMLIMPGVSPASHVADSDKIKVWFRESPLINKIVWVVFGLAGIGLGFYLCTNVWA